MVKRSGVQTQLAPGLRGKKRKKKDVHALIGLMLLLILYSCLIARNLLSGLKTCSEVSSYMFNDGETLLSRPMSTNSCLEDSGKADHDYMVHPFSFKLCMQI